METLAEELGITWGEELFQRGHDRGEALGELRAHRALLRQLIRKRFGAVPEEVSRRIDAADVSTLAAAMEQLLTIASPDELRLGPAESGS